MILCVHCKYKIVKIANLLVTSYYRNSGNCNLIDHNYIWVATYMTI